MPITNGLTSTHAFQAITSKSKERNIVVNNKDYVFGRLNIFIATIKVQEF